MYGRFYLGLYFHTCPTQRHNEVQFEPALQAKVSYGEPVSLRTLFTTVWLGICLYSVSSRHLDTCRSCQESQFVGVLGKAPVMM